MPSHRVVTLHRTAPWCDDDLVVIDATIACGCRIRRAIDRRRLVELADGSVMAAGKYPCPEGHSVPAEHESGAWATG